jgi:hypothetical protein
MTVLAMRRSAVESRLRARHAEVLRWEGEGGTVPEVARQTGQQGREARSSSLRNRTNGGQPAYIDPHDPGFIQR